ncbi:sarcosine oxidase subunit delta [Mameliella sediminis]|uniref:sarcosine oxidase subunit delta n=1 Tax=Mameliella sediminis TaxID=2836866 RepID=UPI001C45B5D0|nr:sarcosine oxidase subunit delta [Mameliella sediminis]MBV7396321.1 sarcosine oxidase subunit delta [Mameliella sediminis]MBY6160732.1 sarcosine oxidase subunit delta [Mameliella alba]MBY6169202.1 sarcosine oxidase subunit delta [Mameliella alba]MBY6173577.1 sarcosine oxidase subunit delta [Mameliella alba]
MRLTCPICGTRDRREFYYQGDAVMLDRPAADAAAQVWADWLHLRDNPAGRTRELWYHEAGCTSWLVVERDTVTHEVFSVELVEAADAD